METLFNDIHYAFRIMRKSPGFTLIIILTLALGIGANTSIFSIVNAVLLRSLPYYDPGRLVKITFNNPGIDLHDVRFSVPELEDLKSRAGVFKEVSVVVSGPTDLTGGEQPEHLEMLEVSPNYFSMLGTTPEIGRLFGPQDFALGFADATVAERTRRQCASPTAGINGRGSPGRANRIREYRKPSSGSRFRKTERNGTSHGAWGWPFSHGAPDADGGARAFLDRGWGRRARSEVDPEFHPSLCSRFRSPAFRI